MSSSEKPSDALCFGFATPQAIYKWQRGKALPTLDNMTVLARVMNVSIEEILIYERR